MPGYEQTPNIDSAASAALFSQISSIILNENERAKRLNRERRVSRETADGLRRASCQDFAFFRFHVSLRYPCCMQKKVEKFFFFPADILQRETF